MKYKLITKNDLEIQKEFLFMSMWLPDYEEQYHFDVLNESFVKKYYSDWGKKGDFGIFMMIDEKPIAMAQLRYKSSMVVNISDLPELIISVKPEYQGQGFGEKLLRNIIENHSEKGIRLGVHPENKKAISLYQKLGFKKIKLKNLEYDQMYMRA